MDNKPSMVAWVALIISILALILAWTAFNRAGADLEAIIAAEVEEAAQEIEQEYDEAIMEVRNEMQQAENEVRDTTADGLEATADELDDAAMDARTDDDGPNN